MSLDGIGPTSSTVQITFKPPDIFSYKATVSATNGAGNPAVLTVTGQGLDGT